MSLSGLDAIPGFAIRASVKIHHYMFLNRNIALSLIIQRGTL